MVDCGDRSVGLRGRRDRRPDPDGRRFYLTRKGLAAVETYLFARYHMYRTVYFHKTSRAAEVMLKLLFRRLAELIDAHTSLPGINPGLAEAFSGRISLTTYLDFDDLTMIRPGWLVLGAGLVVVAVDLVRARFGKRRKPSRAIPA